MYETILIDGTDIKVPGKRLLRVWEDVLETPLLRGDDLTVTDADGQDSVDERPFDAFNLNIQLVLKDATDALYNEARRVLTRMCKPDGTVTLTRRLAYTAANEEHTATARYLSGLKPSAMFAMVDSDLTLVFKVLDGFWSGPTDTVTTGAVTVLGDVRTRRMTITFTGGTNPTLTNSTTGDSVTWTGTVGGTPVVVDVETMTATQGGTDVSGALTWARTFPMTLAAGTNNLSLTGGGSVSTSYTPAYL